MGYFGGGRGINPGRPGYPGGIWIILNPEDVPPPAAPAPEPPPPPPSSVLSQPEPSEVPPLEREVFLPGPGNDIPFGPEYRWDKQGTSDWMILTGGRRIRSISEREVLRRARAPRRTEPELYRLPPALRDALPPLPRTPPKSGARRPRTLRKRPRRTQPLGRFGTAGEALGFVARPSPRPPPPPRIDQPGVYPTAPDIFELLRRVRRPKITRLPPGDLEELRRGGNPFPQPEPDINPRVPQGPPRRLDVPPRQPSPVMPPELLPIPSPEIAAPPPPEVTPPPTRTPPAPTIPGPTPPGRTRRQKPPPSPLRRFQIGTAGASAASILRSIYRRRGTVETPLDRALQAFDPVTTPPGDTFPVAPPGDPVPDRVATPANPALGPPELNRLTALNDAALGLRPRDLARRREEEECKCEETEEEKELNRRPSSVLAKVKSFTRRMSQNSLDNLR